MSQIKQISDADFDNIVNPESGLVLVDFWASWCAPCNMIAPILEQLSEDEDIKDKITIVKLNVDENQATTSRFGIRSIPTLILFNKGKKVGQEIIGVNPKDVIKKAILDAL